jgi:hypothetical protein
MENVLKVAIGGTFGQLEIKLISQNTNNKSD